VFAPKAGKLVTISALMKAVYASRLIVFFPGILIVIATHCIQLPFRAAANLTQEDLERFPAFPCLVMLSSRG
jgi:hypothetical protein